MSILLFFLSKILLFFDKEIFEKNNSNVNLNFFPFFVKFCQIF
jgi:hypothetical protein